MGELAQQHPLFLCLLPCMMKLSLFTCFFIYLKAYSISCSQAYFMLMPVLALTLNIAQLSSSLYLRISLLASADGYSFRSHLLANRIRGTSGSKFSLSCSIQYQSPLRELSSERENTTKTPSELRKKFLATERYLSCPDVSHNQTPTYSPCIFLV